MPSLSDHQSSKTTKMLLIGDSGSGKSGALASLANAGYNLRIIDTDNGLDVLSNYLKDPNSQYKKEALDRVVFATLTDPMRSVGGKLMPVRATVWQRALGLLDNWKTESENLGPISSWGENDVLVIDSLTTIADAAMNFICAMNGRLGQKPFQSDYGEAQTQLVGLLQKLYDENIKCNVVINCHITYIGPDNGIQRGYPNSIGKALPPRIGRYFNSMLMSKTTGSGNTEKHVIITHSTNMVELKTTAPLRVKAEYPISTGLADYFKDVRG